MEKIEKIIPIGWEQEISNRVLVMAKRLADAGIDMLLVADNVNNYYFSGRVFAGYTCVLADGSVHYFVRRPLGLEGDNVNYIRKPEMILDMLAAKPSKVCIALDTVMASDYNRLAAAMNGSEIIDASALLREQRSVKSEFEISLLRECGVHHTMVYNRIPRIYREGMSDIELQVEIEHLLRLEGCLGLFRVHGESMELFMGNILAGENADTPTPYDFAMGGAGLDYSIPVGANGTIIMPGMTVMVDACGNFNGYMTDMSRSFCVGDPGDLARKAHKLSIDICAKLAEESHAGVEAKMLYETAMQMVQEAGMNEYFMGHKQQAGFIGHGLGIEINEAPVLAPRSRDVLRAGNVIAIEPKFVIPHVGAVGIENTYVVRENKLECLTLSPEELLRIDL